MNWVAGIGRDNDGKLCVIWQGNDGGVEPGPIERLRCALPVPGARRGFGTFHLGQGAPHPTRDYLDAIGMGHLESLGQTCYLVPSTAGELVIPAQLLVNAVLGPNTHMRAALFTPQGPKALMTVFVDSTGLRVERTPSRMREFHESRQVGASRVEWAQTFPSGSRAWSSVYARAVGGTLDIALPAVAVEAAFSAIPRAGRLYLVALTLEQFVPTEAPHEFARGLEATQEEAAFAVSAPLVDEVRADAAEGPLGLTGRRAAPMTDGQWTEVQAAFVELGRKIKKARSYSTRDRVDLIREHLASGAPFTRLPANPGLQRGAKVLYLRLRQYGGWPKLEQVLEETLPQSGKTSGRSAGSRAV